MDKPVRAFQALDQFQAHRFPQIGMNLLLVPEQKAKRGGLRHVSEAGELLQRIASRGGQAAELPGHELHHIVGVTLEVNARDVPGPLRMRVIEREQALLDERVDELSDEERISGGPLMHQLGQQDHAVWCAAKRIRHQPPRVFTGEGRQRDLLDDASRLTNRGELAHERM